MTQRSTTLTLVGRALALSVLTVWIAFMPIVGKQGAGTSSLQLAAEAVTVSVAAGQPATYALTVRNPTDAAQGVTLRHRLPKGFSYVPFSAQVRQNGTLIAVPEPTVVGSDVIWTGLTVLPRRTGTHFGMHTFVQDRCDESYIRTQLDRVQQVSGPGAYVKQLFHNITPNSQGPSGCWVYFVNQCYDRSLVPVVRLATTYGDGTWSRPTPYDAYAQAFERVVAGLPRRDGFKLYVEIGNEPNLNMEWGGAANGAEYGRFLVQAAAAIRGLNDPRIVLLNGGLSPTGHMAVTGGLSPTAFIDQMATVPGALDAFDVWASHPYPGNRPPEQNLHDGTAPDYTFLAIDSYVLELDRLAAKGRSGLRVLLTETGYRLGANDLLGPLGIPAITDANRADYIARALRDYWSRWPEVIGVCPFFLLDPSNPSPWSDWVWMNNESSPRQQYYAVQALDKTPSTAAGELTVTFRATAAGWAGTYSGAVSVADGAGGSNDLAGVAPVVVTGATRPSGEIECYEALDNGGFEKDADWEFPGTSAPGGYTEDPTHSGDRAGRVGLVAGTAATSYSSARQTVTLPANTVSATLSLWYHPRSRDVVHGRQYAWLLDAQGARLANALWIASDARAWQPVTFDLLGYAGQQVTVHLGTYFRQGYDPIGMAVDDVSLRVCTAGAPETTETGTPDGAPTLAPLTPGTPSGSPTQALPAPGTPALRLPIVLGDGATSSPSKERAPRIRFPLPPSEGAWGEGDLPATDSPSPLQGEGTGEGDAAAAILAADLAAAEASPRVARPTPAPGWLPAEDGGTDAVAVDAARGRILSAAGTRLLVRDRAGKPLAEVELPARAGAIALDGDSGDAYLTLPDSGQLVRYDGGGATRIAEGLGRPTGLALSPQHLFVGDAAGRRLFVLDRKGHGIIREVALEAAPGVLVFDPLAQRIYVAESGPGTLLALDADTLEPLGRVTLGGLGLPRALALDAEARRLYVAHDLSAKYGAVSVVDVDTWQVLADRSGTWSRPMTGCDEIAIDAARKRLVVGYSGGLVALNPETLDVIEDAPRSRGGASRGLALDPASGDVYVGGEAGSLLRTGPGLSAMQALP